MSDQFRFLENLAANARTEDTPVVDVSSRVLLRLSRETRPVVWPWAVFASSVSACAVIALVSSLPFISLITDPFSALFLAAEKVLH